MVWVVDASARTLGVTYTVPQLCALLGSVHHPQNIGFPSARGRMQDLLTRQSAQGPGDVDVVRSIGLLTCSSVIYTDAAGAAFYVYHANSGDVTREKHEEIVTTMGGDARNLFVAYAHNGEDQDYVDSVQDIVDGFGTTDVKMRVPTDQIVRIRNLRFSNFGVNRHGWLTH